MRQDSSLRFFVLRLDTSLQASPHKRTDTGPNQETTIQMRSSLSTCHPASQESQWTARTSLPRPCYCFPLPAERYRFPRGLPVRTKTRASAQTIFRPNWTVILSCMRLVKRSEPCWVPTRWEALSKVKPHQLSQGLKTWNRSQPTPAMKPLKSGFDAREHNIITLVGPLRWAKWWMQKGGCWA